MSDRTTAAREQGDAVDTKALEQLNVAVTGLS